MVFEVRTTIEGRNGRVWFLFDTDHPDIASVHQALVRDGQIMGDRLDTKALVPGQREVVGRTPYILAKTEIATVRPSNAHLIEGGR